MGLFRIFNRGLNLVYKKNYRLYKVIAGTHKTALAPHVFYIHLS